MEKIKILKQKRFKCAFCDGSGIRPGDRIFKNLCSVCNGRGYSILNQPAIRCPYCQGKGRVSLGLHIPCIVCRGRGVFEANKPFEICPRCQGRGKKTGETLTCFQCGGKGIIAKNEGPEKIFKKRMGILKERLKEFKREAQPKLEKIEEKIGEVTEKIEEKIEEAEEKIEEIKLPQKLAPEEKILAFGRVKSKIILWLKKLRKFIKNLLK